jgi:class 3 adenylate cyclase
MVFGRRKEDVTRKAEDALVGFLKILVDLEVANTAPRSEATDLAVYSRHRGIAARWEARGEPFKVQLGCGLHMGTAIEGAIGSKWKIDASYLSPAVNLSARLEAATKQYGIPLLISHDFALQLSEPAQGMLRLLDCVAVKGSLEPMRIYTFDLFSYPRDFGEDAVLHWDRAADGFEPLPQQYLAAVARNVLVTRLGPRAVLPAGQSAQSQVALLSPLGARDSGRQLPWDLGPLPGVPLVRRESGASASSVGLADGWMVGAPATPVPAGSRVGPGAANDHTDWPAHTRAEHVAQAAHLQHPAMALPSTPVGSAPTHVPRLSYSALRSPAAHAPSLSGVLTAGETPLAVPADPSVARLLAQQAVPDFRIRIDFASDPYLREMQSISRDKAAGFDFPSEAETVAWYRARFGLPALANPARSQSPDAVGQVEAAPAALSPPAGNQRRPSGVALSGLGKAGRRGSAVSNGVVGCTSPHSPTPPLRLEALSPGVPTAAADPDRGTSAGAPEQSRIRRSSAVDRRAARALQVAADREMGDALVKRFFDAFGVAVNAYLSGDWPLARAMLLEAQRVRPSDGPTRTLLRVIDELGVGQQPSKAAPPDWKGYRVLTEK